jgi:hypothetical protein
MKSDKVERIIKAFDRIWKDTTPITGAESLDDGPKSHLAKAQVHGSVYTDMGVILAAAMLGRVDALRLVEGGTPHELLAAMDTRDKFRAVLSEFSEEELDTAIARLPVLRKVVPTLRANLLSAVRSLPHDPGGRPRKIKEEEKRPIRMLHPGSDRAPEAGSDSPERMSLARASPFPVTRHGLLGLCRN